MSYNDNSAYLIYIYCNACKSTSSKTLSFIIIPPAFGLYVYLRYDRDDSSGLQLGDYEEEDVHHLAKEEKLKSLKGGAPAGAPGRSLAEMQRHRDNELWEELLMNRGGAGQRRELSLEEEDAEETEKEHVICRQLLPPFLSGYKPSERNVSVVRDATSDMATLARYLYQHLNEFAADLLLLVLLFFPLLSLSPLHRTDLLSICTLQPWLVHRGP